jgi:hypothetical protein
MISYKYPGKGFIIGRRQPYGNGVWIRSHIKNLHRWNEHNQFWNGQTVAIFRSKLINNIKKFL